MRRGQFPGLGWLVGLLDDVVQTARLRVPVDLMMFRKSLHTLDGVVAAVGQCEGQIDRLLDVDGLTSLDEERMLELAGVDKEDFCEWAAARAGCMKLIVWALGRGCPWGGYPPGR